MYLVKNDETKKKSRPKKAIASTVPSRISIYALFARFYLLPELVYLLMLNLSLYPGRLISLFRFFSLYRLFLAGKSNFKKFGFKRNCVVKYIFWKICANCDTHGTGNWQLNLVIFLYFLVLIINLINGCVIKKLQNSLLIVLNQALEEEIR